LALATEGRRPVPVLLVGEIARRLGFSMRELALAAADLERQGKVDLRAWSNGLALVVRPGFREVSGGGK
jgi:hypothetical protein